MTISSLSYTFAGATTTIWYMDAGDVVPRHQHLVDHLLAVLDGAVNVTIFDAQSLPVAITPQNAPLILPANIDHQFQATVNGTELISMISAPPNQPQQGTPGQPGKTGVVALAQGPSSVVVAAI